MISVSSTPAHELLRKKDDNSTSSSNSSSETEGASSFFSMYSFGPMNSSGSSEGTQEVAGTAAATGSIRNVLSDQALATLTSAQSVDPVQKAASSLLG